MNGQMCAASICRVDESMGSPLTHAAVTLFEAAGCIFYIYFRECKRFCRVKKYE